MKKCFIVIWVIFYLVLIDIFINIVFHYPNDPNNIHPSFLQGYFEYGRSVEGKLAIMTRHSEDESAPRVKGGWLNSNRHNSLPNKTSKPDEVLVALYGMSHTQCLWEAIQKTDKQYLVRGFMAAGATPNWSYAAYEFDKGRHKAYVVILGIMTEGVSLVTSTTGMTAYFDMSYPYTFPRYTVKNGKLFVSHPPFLDAKSYIEYFYDQSKWNQYRAWLAKNDKLYDPILFRRSVFDHSAFIRLLRRAYSEKEKKKISSSVYTNNGFNENSEEIVILRAIVKTFAESARNENIIPIIYIVNTQGQGDHLFRVLKPVLDKNKIPYLSTHIICPPDDPRVYLSENSHFILSKDMELAKEIINIIENEIEKNRKLCALRIKPSTDNR
jgi:hypothetical protein